MKTINTLKAILLMAMAAFAFQLSGCGGSDDEPNPNPNPPTNDCTTSTATFTQANTIIQANCAISGCHASGSSNGPGPLTNYDQIFNARTSIKSAVESGIMPKNRTLSASQKSTIICWIEKGALNN